VYCFIIGPGFWIPREPITRHNGPRFLHPLNLEYFFLYPTFYFLHPYVLLPAPTFFAISELTLIILDDFWNKSFISKIGFCKQGVFFLKMIIIKI